MSHESSAAKACDCPEFEEFLKQNLESRCRGVQSSGEHAQTVGAVNWASLVLTLAPVIRELVREFLAKEKPATP